MTAKKPPRKRFPEIGSRITNKGKTEAALTDVDWNQAARTAARNVVAVGGGVELLRETLDMIGYFDRQRVAQDAQEDGDA